MAESTATGLVATKGLELLSYLSLNAFQVSIFLEELREAYGLEYTAQTIDIFKNVQKEPWFTELNPNGTVPVLVDHDQGGYAIMETNAIINYLVRKFDPEHKFSFQDPLEACTAEQWMEWKQGGLAPIAAQAIQFYRFIEVRHAYPTYRFHAETLKLYGILEGHLAQGEREYVAGSGKGRYSVADMSIWPFIDGAALLGIDLEEFPWLFKWFKRVGEREAVKKGTSVPLGVAFTHGWEGFAKMKQDDPEGFEARESVFRDALKAANDQYAKSDSSV